MTRKAARQESRSDSQSHKRVERLSESTTFTAKQNLAVVVGLDVVLPGRHDFRASQRFDSAQRDNIVILSEVEGRATGAQEARRERPRQHDVKADGHRGSDAEEKSRRKAHEE
jgi:hypothetical protein